MISGDSWSSTDGFKIGDQALKNREEYLNEYQKRKK